MASARGGGIRRRAGHRVVAQVTVQVGPQGARNVGLGKLRIAQGGLGQIEAAVKHQTRLATGQPGLQLGRRNQGGVHQQIP